MSSYHSTSPAFGCYLYQPLFIPISGNIGSIGWLEKLKVLNNQVVINGKLFTLSQDVSSRAPTDAAAAEVSPAESPATATATQSQMALLGSPSRSGVKHCLQIQRIRQDAQAAKEQAAKEQAELAHGLNQLKAMFTKYKLTDEQALNVINFCSGTEYDIAATLEKIYQNFLTKPPIRCDFDERLAKLAINIDEVTSILGDPVIKITYVKKYYHQKNDEKKLMMILQISFCIPFMLYLPVGKPPIYLNTIDFISYNKAVTLALEQLDDFIRQQGVIATSWDIFRKKTLSLDDSLLFCNLSQVRFLQYREIKTEQFERYACVVFDLLPSRIMKSMSCLDYNNPVYIAYLVVYEFLQDQGFRELTDVVSVAKKPITVIPRGNGSFIQNLHIKFMACNLKGCIYRAACLESKHEAVLELNIQIFVPADGLQPIVPHKLEIKSRLSEACVIIDSLKGTVLSLYYARRLAERAEKIKKLPISSEGRLYVNTLEDQVIDSIRAGIIVTEKPGNINALNDKFVGIKLSNLQQVEARIKEERKINKSSLRGNDVDSLSVDPNDLGHKAFIKWR